MTHAGQKYSHLAECYACGTEIEVSVPHEDNAETAVTCPACGAPRTFATYHVEDFWYTEDVTNAETDAIGYGVLTQATAGDEDERTAQYMDHLRSVRG